MGELTYMGLAAVLGVIRVCNVFVPLNVTTLLPSHQNNHQHTHHIYLVRVTVRGTAQYRFTKSVRRKKSLHENAMDYFRPWYGAWLCI